MSYNLFCYSQEKAFWLYSLKKRCCLCTFHKIVAILNGNVHIQFIYQYLVHYSTMKSYRTVFRYHITHPRAWPLCIVWISLFHLCLQTVAEVWGHPEDLIVLSQQSSGERGRRMHTKHQPALFTGERNKWNCIVISETEFIKEAVQPYST